jgi:hypothetical protein
MLSSVDWVSDAVMFDVLISKHLTPYDLADGAKSLLPFKYGAGGWESRSGASIAALGGATTSAVNKAMAAIDESTEEFFDTVNTDRKKLTIQNWSGSEWLVFTAAGGKFPCAAYVRGSKIPCDKTIIDQTLYWGRVATEDEAIYITGLINSPAVINVIRAHQPRGAFGERHIHKLAFDRTPQYLASDPKHASVVACTKALLTQWAARKMQPDINPLLNAPEKHLITRRAKMRAALKALPAWQDYELATNALYSA